MKKIQNIWTLLKGEKNRGNSIEEASEGITTKASEVVYFGKEKITTKCLSSWRWLEEVQCLVQRKIWWKVQRNNKNGEWVCKYVTNTNV